MLLQENVRTRNLRLKYRYFIHSFLSYHFVFDQASLKIAIGIARDLELISVSGIFSDTVCVHKRRKKYVCFSRCFV